MLMLKSNVVCSTARSGSNLLCSYVQSLGVIGPVNEWLNTRLMAQVAGKKLKFNEAYYTAHPEEILTKLIENNRGGDGSFSSKVHYIEFYNMLKNQFNPFKLMSNPSFIHLVRKDIIAQAISYEKAHQQDSWTSFTKPVKNAEYKFAATCQKLKLIMDSNDGWANFFQTNNFQAKIVVYEELEKNPRKVVEEVMHHWGYSVTSEQLSHISTGLKRQTDNINEEWRERFEADLKANNIKVG